MKILLMLSLLIVSSCANQYYRQPTAPKEIVWTPNKEFWIGKHEETLALHPIFAIMPVESRKTPAGVETRRYVNGGVITSQSECKGNQCAGAANNGACNHVFYLKGMKITNYQIVGNCGEQNLELRPLDADGRYEYSASETQQLNEARAIASTNSKLTGSGSCDTRADCFNGMTCKYSDSQQKGTCVDAGIFGKLLYR